MYASLISLITTKLQAVSEVKSISSVPKTKIDAYPHVFFKPARLENAYYTNQDNEKVYNFLLIVIIGTNGTTLENTFGTVLPKVVDAIIEQFDGQWDFGTTDGHRMRATITSVDDWGVSGEQDGIEVYAPLNLEVRVNTDV